MHFKRFLRCASRLTFAPGRPIIRNPRFGCGTLRFAWLVCNLPVTLARFRSLSFYLTTFSFKRLLCCPLVWARGTRWCSGTLSTTARSSLVDHLLSRLLERASSFVVQLLLLCHGSRAVGLAHLCGRGALVRVKTFTVVRCVHNSSTWRLFLGCSIGSYLLLGSTLKKRQEMVLSANWFELTFEKRAKNGKFGIKSADSLLNNNLIIFGRHVLLLAV